MQLSSNAGAWCTSPRLTKENRAGVALCNNALHPGIWTSLGAPAVPRHCKHGVGDQAEGVVGAVEDLDVTCAGGGGAQRYSTCYAQTCLSSMPARCARSQAPRGRAAQVASGSAFPPARPRSQHIALHALHPAWIRGTCGIECICVRRFWRLLGDQEAAGDRWCCPSACWLVPSARTHTTQQHPPAAPVSRGAVLRHCHASSTYSPAPPKRAAPGRGGPVGGRGRGAAGAHRALD